MSSVYDAVVVGAGPYGLSAAAHLRGRGLHTAVFGKTLGLWRDNMPKGMFLRSHWWATNLSDPRGDYGLERFCKEAKLAKGYPMPLDTFVEYGLWFQQRAVPQVDETYVSSIERQDSRFHITLADGREVQSHAVVMATGPHPYANRLAECSGLRAGLVSHSSDHRDFSRFKGLDVTVIGGGQSAIEYAALLNEAGANVQLVARRRVLWHAPDRAEVSTARERVIAPNASLGPGWKNWVLDHLPLLFYKFPQEWKDWYNGTYESGATHWLRDRVIGKITVREGCTVSRWDAVDGKLDATLSDGTTLRADHVILATGYKTDLAKLTMIHPSLRAQIKTDRAFPTLSGRFESSVPGLYFVGITSFREFGPLYRFVAGCGAAARRVAGAIARARAGQSVRWHQAVAQTTPTSPLPH